MIKKKFKTVLIGDAKPELTVEFEDKKYEVISTLFVADFSTICELAIKKIEEINEGKISEFEGTGNICNVKITKDNITISDIFNELNSCTISTDDFEELIKDWKLELSKLN